MLPTWAIQLIFVVSLIGGATGYYMWTQHKIEKLTNTVQILNMQKEINEKTINGLRSAAIFNNERYNEAMHRANAAEAYKAEVVKIFQEHDLTKLATAKPGLIEKRINEGTKAALDSIESITDN